MVPPFVLVDMGSFTNVTCCENLFEFYWKEVEIHDIELCKPISSLGSYNFHDISWNNWHSCSFSNTSHSPLLLSFFHPDLSNNIVMQYVKHMAFTMAKREWNVVVSNHRGLGGVSITVSIVIWMPIVDWYFLKGGYEVLLLVALWMNVVVPFEFELVWSTANFRWIFCTTFYFLFYRFDFIF